MISIECFSCSGGMAEGFRRAGIHFDWVFDKDPNAVASYTKNLGHAPVTMDVRDLLRMVRGGWNPGPVRLFVADPPCTPWSRAGKRLGTEDERDMLHETTELIAALRPQSYLIGNVPGLEDSTQWHNVQSALAPLRQLGYCIADYTSLDAADFGVPQHRVRPFWFGHLSGPCIRWPLPTHGSPHGNALPGFGLKPWVTCREALQHLPLEELGRPVRLKRPDSKHPPADPEAPAMTVRAGGGGGNALPHLVENARHPPAEPDGLSGTIGAKYRGQTTVMRLTTAGHPTARADGQSPTNRGGGEGHSAPDVVLELEDLPNQPAAAPDDVMRSITTQAGTTHRLEWPWNRPATTVHAEARLAPPGHHPESGSILTPAELRGSKKRKRQPQSERVGDMDRPGETVDARPARSGMGAGQVKSDGPNAVVLSEKAAAILQGFPDDWLFAGETKKARWSQIGQAMPPGLAHAVASAVKEQLDRTEAERRSA